MKKVSSRKSSRSATISLQSPPPAVLRIKNLRPWDSLEQERRFWRQQEAAQEWSLRKTAGKQRRRVEREILNRNDARYYHPAQQNRPLVGLARFDTRLSPDPLGRKAWDYGRRFVYPERVSVCLRRKIKRRVLHALRLTAKGAGAKKRKRTRWSLFGC